MDSDKPIPAPKKSLANIIGRGAAGIQAELIGAAPIHNMFGSGQVSSLEQEVVAEDLQTRITGKPPEVIKFTRGDDVVDTERKRTGTVIRVLKAAAEDGQTRYEIVDSRGNAW